MSRRSAIAAQTLALLLMPAAGARVLAGAPPLDAQGERNMHIGAVAGAERLAADDALRAGMKAIRDATLEVHTLVTHRRMPPEMALRYAVSVKRHAEAIRVFTRREPAAAAEAERLVGFIVRGAEAVTGRDPSLDAIGGIIAVDEALMLYGQRFEDADWKPLREGRETDSVPAAHR